MILFFNNLDTIKISHCNREGGAPWKKSNEHITTFRAQTIGNDIKKGKTKRKRKTQKNVLQRDGKNETMTQGNPMLRVVEYPALLSVSVCERVTLIGLADGRW